MIKKVKKFFDREQNLLIHIIATILVIIFGLLFKINSIEWLFVILMIAIVICAELINSSIELCVDMYTKEYHPLAKIAKDVAASAVVLSAITALCVGLYIFLPKIINIISKF